MNRRNFLKSSGMFIVGSMIINQLPTKSLESSFVFPETKWDYNDRWKINWTGFRSSYDSQKVVGHWIGHPITNGKFDSYRYSIQSTVPVFLDEYNISTAIGLGGAACILLNTLAKEEIQAGLDTMLDLIERGEYLAQRHNIYGIVPVNTFCGIDRQLLSTHIRRCRKAGLMN